jgi:MFS transporter, CP family, cyanate transporter
MSDTRPLWRGRVAAVAGILLLAFSARVAVASLSPLLDHIDQSFALPSWIVGLIGTAPPVCFALFGILTPSLERRFGLQRLAVVVLIAVTIGLVARGFATSAGLLLAATALIFAAVGMGNVLLPPLVKVYFPDRIGLMTSLYATTMAVSTFLPPLVAVPVADATSWRVSVAMWAAFSVAGLIPWITLLVRSRGSEAVGLEGARQSVAGRIRRLPLSWAMAVAFAASSVFAYTSFTWLPSILVDAAGVSHLEAGALLSLFGAVGLPCSILVPVLVARSRRAAGILFTVAVVSGLAGVAGMLWIPSVATPLWVVLLAIENLLFPLMLALLNLRTRTHEASVALSGFVQSIGYAIASVFPFAVGLLHTTTGGWTAALLVLGAVVIAAIPAGFAVSRPHTVEDEWERRHGAW